MAKNVLEEALEKIWEKDSTKKQAAPDKANGMKRSLLERENTIDTVSQELLAYYERVTNQSRNDLMVALQPKAQQYLEKREKEAMELAEGKEVQAEMRKQGVPVNTHQVEQKMKEDKTKGKPVDIRIEAQKAIYEAMLEEYHEMVEKMYTQTPNGMMYTGDPSMNKEEFTKCLLYEKKLQQMRGSIPGIREDATIQEKEHNYYYREASYKKAVFKTTQQDRIRIDMLQKRVQYLEEEIKDLADRSEGMDPDKFKAQMDALQKEYLETTKDLRTLEPDPDEMYLQDARYQEQQDIRMDHLGRSQVEQVEKEGGSMTTWNLQQKEMKDSQDDMGRLQQEKVHRLYEMLEEAKELFQREGTSNPKLYELLESMEAILGDTTHEVDTIATHQDKEEVSHTKGEEKEANKSEKSSLEQELGRVYAPNEIAVNERMANVQKGIERLDGKVQVQERAKIR